MAAAAKYKEVTLDSLNTLIRSYFPDADLSLVKKAYEVAEQAHHGQTRSSGEPYIIHPLEVAHTLAELQLDLASIATGLLHDVVEDTTVTLETIEKEFGRDVAELVDGVTKLSKITFKTSEEKQAENFRKMILAMAKDIRVILVKLCDRLNNMRTLNHLPEHKRARIAQETQDIYAPIANRLGISWIKIELEDLCLRHLHPDVYYKLAEAVTQTKKEREKYIEEVSEILLEKLGDYDVVGTVSGRAKHFHSIFKKMERRHVGFEEIHDLIAFRIIVENITECYKALGVIHATYKPVPGRFKDYIAMPKANGYQSLHTTVIGPKGERVEIQIRTQEMNQVADAGIAAHWKYKEGKFDNRSGENVEWVNRLLQWHKDLKDPNEFLETVKIDLFAEDVFVFTPKGQVKQLPYGSTPIDFAYAVHTDVGHHCVGAKVDGKIVPLKHRLKSGDTIEVITSPSQSPSKDWLKIAKSSRAKAKIRAYIKEAERNKAKIMGQDIFEKELKSLGSSISRIEKSGDLQKLLPDYGCKTPDDLFIGIGYGRLLVADITAKLLPKETTEKKAESVSQFKSKVDETFLKRVFNAAKRRSEARNAISVSGVGDVLIRFARCCNPLPGDAIVGFITRGRGVTVHVATCAKALDTDQVRKVDVQWGNVDKSAARRHVRIRVYCSDTPGLLATMSQTIAGAGVNIASANVRTTKDKKAICLFDVEVTDLDQLRKVTLALEGKKGVLAVERVRS